MSTRLLLMRLAVAVCFSAPLFAVEPPGVWLDVPFISQSKEGCGSASVAMVMQYWLSRQQQSPGEAAQEPVIYRALYSRKAGGIYASDLESYLREHGFRTFAFRGTWNDLRHHLEKGRPLLVAPRPAEGAPLHYVVVAGMDWERDLVMVNDPLGRKLMNANSGALSSNGRPPAIGACSRCPRRRLPDSFPVRAGPVLPPAGDGPIAIGGCSECRSCSSLQGPNSFPRNINGRKWCAWSRRSRVLRPN